MAIYATSSLGFQAVQEAFKFSFIAIYITLAFLFTIINRQALQLARSYSSIADIYFSVHGESRRAAIRQRCDQNVPNPFNYELNDSNIDNQNTSYPGPVNNGNHRISKFTLFLVYFFAGALLCALYAGYPLKILFGELSKPIYKPTRINFAEINNTYYANTNIFAQSKNQPYSTNYNYTETDLRDSWVYTNNSLFDATENPYHADILGSTSYKMEYKNSTINGSITCAVQDEIQIMAMNTDASYVRSLNPYAMIPKLHCSLVTTAGARYYSGMYYDAKDADDTFKRVYTAIDRMPYANTNFTLFTLSKNERNHSVLNANVIIIDSTRVNVDTIFRYNMSNNTGYPNYYGSIMANVETFGYNSESEFLGFMDADSFSTQYIYVPKFHDYFEYALMYYAQETQHVLTFSVKDEVRSALDPRYDYYARNIIGYQPGSKMNLTGDFVSYQTVYYRTQSVKYESTSPSKISPEMEIDFDDGSNLTLPFIVYPLLMNSKTAPAAHAILSRYAPDDVFEFYNTIFETSGKLMWNITVQIYVIAILFGLSLIVAAIYMVSISCSYLYTVPGYYELLRDHHEKGSGGERSIRSIFSIMQPATVGSGYNQRLDTNHIGVLDKTTAKSKPHYNRPFAGKNK